jgi:uroporphyrinogen-III synthase
MRVLVTRPAENAGPVVRALEAAGHQALLSPLLAPEAVPWTLPAGRFDGVIATSAAVFRLGGPGLTALTKLPLLAVGTATGDAARTAGFREVTEGTGGVAALLDGVEGRFLRLAGEDRTPVETRAELVPVTLYRARFTEGFTAEAAAALGRNEIDWALLFSSRSATRFASLVDSGGYARARLSVGALSPAIAKAAGTGWRTIVAAPEPTTTALLTATGLACDKAGRGAA